MKNSKSKKDKNRIDRVAAAKPAKKAAKPSSRIKTSIAGFALSVKGFALSVRRHTASAAGTAARFLRSAAVSAVRFIKSFPKRFVRFFRLLPGRTRSFIKNFPENRARFAAFVRRTSGILLEKYKRWLYDDGIKKVSPRVKNGASRWAAALISVALFASFGLYYFGVYDVRFIDRPEAWLENREKFYAIFAGNQGGDEPVPTPEPKPEPDTEKTEKPTVPSVDISNTFKRRNRNSKINYATVFRTSAELEAEGYYLTDSVYDENTCEVGVMSYGFNMPNRFSRRNMQVRSWQITEFDDGRASTVEETEITAERPAVYLYMGYIIYDDGRGGMYLCDSAGNILMRYDDSYIPAMARNASGEPLFYKSYTYSADIPVAYEVNELGEEVVTETRRRTLTGKKYYTVSPSGAYFIEDDYVEERDGRGLNFDFPASYGLPDGQIIKVGIMTPKLSYFLDGRGALVNFMNWNYFIKGDAAIPNLDEVIGRYAAYDALSLEEKKQAVETATTPKDFYDIDLMLPYSSAFNYNGGYATVVTDQTGEDAKYETKELRVINRYGEFMFDSKKIYYNSSFKNYCSDRYLLPLSRGEDSVGHLYFDHGLLRIRKICYDNYQLEEFGDFRVNIDEDVLVYPNGKEFPIPAGYRLCGYSDGVMVLERGGLYGYMDYRGRWIADPKYKKAEAFHGGVGVLTDKSGKVCAVNVNGDYVLPLKYDYIQNRSDGLIAAYSDVNGWTVYGIFTK